jgi:hypothetical protein
LTALKNIRVLIVFGLLFVLNSSISGQDSKIIGYLIAGVEFSENAISRYTKPAAEGLVYGLTAGWNNSGSVNDPWKVSLALVTNGTFIPSEKRSFAVDLSDYSNLSLPGGGSILSLPTIFGETDSKLGFVANLDGNDYEIEVPSGIGFASVNLLPTAFVQASVGLPKNTELKLRYFPTLNIDDTKLGMYGAGLQHEFSSWFPGSDIAGINMSAFIGYTRLLSLYSFDAGGIIDGTGEEVEMILNAWSYSLIGSKDFGRFGLFMGMGYVSGATVTSLNGTYDINLLSETIRISDPFSISNKISGFRFDIGTSIAIGKILSVWLDYTLQGYNNLSFGLNFNI